ncbi:LmbE-like protein [Paramagnetospirillum magnetotacticum MS-1]|uniref:LmbE-like protein n=1 Tax=Paramagnetospirillum magnetotacticum MS-1 TaxID=272627 RepID=A0A0C2UXB1_PARME|nr:PIG-L family deacetylase [Paramagnetospirillum magnetotacticum]KIL97471.1 LmbE-like protein [Paramagnetospirillum magnetotacticum MS-1]
MTASILVLAPHPDDEVVGFSAMIGRARASGSRVAVLWLTDGIPAAELLWPWQRSGRSRRVAVRTAEAVAAAKLLGAEAIGPLPIPTRRLKDEFAVARRAVLDALDRLGADALWVPAYEGGHQDHDVASFLARGLRHRVEVFEAPLYNFAAGRVNSQCFIGGVAGQVIALTPDEQVAKRLQLAVYGSESGNLDYVQSAREALRPQAEYDYSRPPHPGLTFYQRFQWVPFRHPRIDFTTPAEVCDALAKLGKEDL